MSRYLVTGASGFLGSILTRELERLGHDLVLVDKRSQVVSDTKHLTIKVDLSCSESIQSVVDAGPFDGVVCL